jgi:hypothetical protein
MKTRQHVVMALLLVFVVCNPPFAFAETKTQTAEATYTMGNGETPSFAEAQVLQRAKQVALEQAGTFVESYTKVQNLNLTTNEIQTIAGGVMTISSTRQTSRWQQRPSPPILRAGKGYTFGYTGRTG